MDSVYGRGTRTAYDFVRPVHRALPTWRNWQRTALVMRRLGVRVPPSALVSVHQPDPRPGGKAMGDVLRADHIGARIAYWRRRRSGMTQAVLAGLAGVSQSYISHVESGRKGIERRSTLVAIAGALQVSVADLLDQPGEPTDPAYQRASAAVPALRVALAEIVEGEVDPPIRGPEQMDAALDQLSQLRASARYVEMATALPGILRDAPGHGPHYLARVGYDVGDVLKSLGYRDLALSAARVAVNGALDAEDPAWIGATRYFYTLALPMEAPKLSSKVAT